MSNIIIDRIIQIQKEVNPNNIAAFEVSIGKKSGYLNIMRKRSSYPSSEVLKNIVDKHPKYSLEWILGISDTKFLNKNDNLVNEDVAIYGSHIAKNDFLGLSQRIELVIEQNNKILDKLNRGIVKEIIASEKKRIGDNKNEKKTN